MKPKISIAIPSHNNERVIAEALRSAFAQDYPDKEVLVIDDASTDNTAQVVRDLFPKARLIINEQNLGIGKNLEKLMKEAHGRYIVYLCSDDLFASTKVVGDIVQTFNNLDPEVGVIGRYYYFFRDGYPGAIGVCRDKNILTNSCCPSGMAFRRCPGIVGTNKIFVEMPSIVAQYLKDWRWTMFEWDTVAARFHPGGNTGTKTSYFTESPWQNWVDLIGPEYYAPENFIMLKNRAPKLLWREICIALKYDKKRLLKFGFIFYALTAMLVPATILRPLTNFWRHRFTRLNAKIIERGNH